jgi:two-component system, cell cycle response regulator
MPMNRSSETRREKGDKDFPGTRPKYTANRFVDSPPQVVHGKRIEVLVNKVFDVAGLRQSLKESMMIADFCTTVTASLLPEKVLLAAAKKLYEYFEYKFMVVSFDATADYHQEGFYPGDLEREPARLQAVLGMIPDMKKKNIRGYKSLGLAFPGEHAVSGKELCCRLPFAKGAVTFVTDSDLNQAFSSSFLDRILEIFAIALQNAREFGRVKEQSMRDSLTGLFNRRVLDELLELEECKRRADPLSLLVIDLDNFKSINDTHGHPAGDLVLQTVAKVLRDNSRGSDLVVRNGGEEFAVLLPTASATVALEVGERMRKGLENVLVTYNNCEIPITGSVGIAHRSGKDVFPVKDLVIQADEALYQAKKSGKNRVCFYSASPVLINTNH